MLESPGIKKVSDPDRFDDFMDDQKSDSESSLVKSSKTASVFDSLLVRTSSNSEAKKKTRSFIHQDRGERLTGLDNDLRKSVTTNRGGNSHSQRVANSNGFLTAAGIHDEEFNRIVRIGLG